MYKLLEARRRQQRERLEVARTYVEGLARVLGQVSALVYGSVVRGDFRPGSDIDILVISDALPEGVLERLRLLYSVATGREEPKGYRPAEFERMRARRHPTIVAALGAGQVLRDDLGLFGGLGVGVDTARTESRDG